MHLPETQSLTYASLINDIEKGILKIPQFQRDFVWTKVKAAKLLDSIVKGYPIGTFIFWKTKEPLRSIRNLGNATLPKTPAGDYIQYVLDGQQRLTSLFAILKGLQIQRENRVDNFSDIFIDLSATEDQDIVITDISEKKDSDVVKIVDLINGDLTFLANFPKQYHAALSEYKKRIESYAFPAILIREATIDVATEIFTRINVTGKPLSVFEIMVAKTFDDKKNFDLAEKYDELISRLRSVDYETISEATVMQTVSIIIKKECQKKVILTLNKAKFIKTWPLAIDAIEKTVDYFRDFYRIPVSKLLPYNALIIPFSYFFYHHPKKPSGEVQKYLQDFFWRISLSGRYSHSLETRIAQDIKKIDFIIKGKLPTYEYPVDLSPEFVGENGRFSAGRSYIKAILCIFAYRQPKSFSDNSIVRINNDWLKQANSKNYHHFFPKAYLKKKNYQDFYVNHIANITIVDELLNKGEIGQKAPAVYMKKFKKDNQVLTKTMKTHLINLDSYGVWDNDYEEFYSKRCSAIAKELKKRVIFQDVDKHKQTVIQDDFEETELLAYRDREEPHSSPLPHHAAYGSVLRDSADRASSDPGERKPK